MGKDSNPTGTGSNNANQIAVIASLSTVAIVLFFQLAAALLSLVVPGIGDMAMQTIAQSIFMFTPALIAFRAMQRDAIRTVLIGEPEFRRDTFVAIAGAAACMLGVQGLLSVQDALVPESLSAAYNSVKELFDSEYATLLGTASWSNITLAVIGACLVPAVTEELLFRGYLLTALRYRLGNAQSVIVSSLIFAILHFHPVNFLALFAIGVFLGCLALRTRSLYAPIIAHFLNNLFSIVSYFADTTSHAGTPTEGIPLYYSLPMLIGGAWAVYYVLSMRGSSAHQS